MGKNRKRKNSIKTYKKLLNFYKIAIDPSIKDLTKTDNQILLESVSAFFKEKSKASIKDISFDKISLDENHFFGSIFKTTELDILTNLKNNKTHNNISPEDVILENFTYFYIDFKKLYICSIKTQKIQYVDSYVKDLLEYKGPLNIKIAPLEKNEQEMEELNAKSVNISFFNADKYVGLKDTKNFDCEFENLKLVAKIKKHSPDFVKNIRNIFGNNYNIKKISISTNDEDIDILKNVFTKHVSIELSKDYFKDLSIIETKLSEELLKIIHT